MTYDSLFSRDTHSFFRSPVREIFKRVDLNSIYSFAGGYPSADTFPLDKFAEAMQRVTSRHGAQAFQYGATQGVTELRQVLSQRYGVPLQRVQITTSSQQGIDICTRILVDPGDAVLSFNPSYLGALQSFSSYRAHVEGIRQDGGSLAGEITRTVQRLHAQGHRVKFFYTIPDFQNPTGQTLSLDDRKTLVEMARRHGFLIVEDSPYRELRYEGEDIPTLYSLDPDVVIHLGSFSKIMAPGFRIGWIFAHEDVLDRIFVCKQSLDLCPPVFDQYVAADFMASGALDDNLRRSIALYKGKRDLMLSLLAEHMPQGVSWTHPDGGLFLFLTLPEGFDAVKFYDTALDAGVAYVAGSFFHTDGSGANTMRLNFSFMDEEKIAAGIRLLASLLEKALADETSSSLPPTSSLTDTSSLITDTSHLPPASSLITDTSYLYKFQGAGNDFLIADNRQGTFSLTPVEIAALCIRRFGIGADGFMLLEDGGDGYDFRMVYYNSDGSGGMMCGNGGRCIAAFAAARGCLKPGAAEMHFLAPDGPHKAQILGNDGNTATVRLQMKDVADITRWQCPEKGLKGFFLDTGTRHLVIPVNDVDDIDVVSLGRELRWRDEFAPVGTNVDFVALVGDTLHVRTYEKGVEDETFACGTGIAAAAIAMARGTSGRQTVSVHALGDFLSVDFIPTPGGAEDVWLTGPATYVATVTNVSVRQVPERHKDVNPVET